MDIRGSKYLFPIFNKKLFLSSIIKKQLTIEQLKEIEQISNELQLQIIIGEKETMY